MHKILIIEDSRSYADLLKVSIEKEQVFSVTTCNTLAETKQLLDSQTDFTAAILDLNLPDANEGEVVDCVLNKNIPSIILTGSLSEKLRTHIVARPIVDYVIKQNWSDIHYVISLLHRLKKNPDIKVLVVDDDKAFREYTSALLKIHGYQVLQAENGQQALEKIAQFKDDIYLVLTDFHMPIMDGMALTQAIRKEFNRTQISIIALTSDEAPFLSAQFLKAGANDLIKKPFLIEELYSRVNQHIEVIENIATIRKMAQTDQLTGLYNRRFLFDQGNKKYLAMQQENKALTVAIIDIDYFKKINDKYGHSIGDIALQKVAQLLISKTRNNDIVSRFGGEEFCLLIFNHQDPYVFFEMLRRDIGNLEILVSEHETFTVTISIGFHIPDNEVMAESIRKADLALYQAKEEGRNRVVKSIDSNNSHEIPPRIRTEERDKSII